LFSQKAEVIRSTACSNWQDLSIALTPSMTLSADTLQDIKNPAPLASAEFFFA